MFYVKENINDTVDGRDDAHPRSGPGGELQLLPLPRLRQGSIR